MPKIVIDSALCTGCGACVATCPAQVFAQEGAETPSPAARERRCIDCGHCVAVCPHGAIAHASFPEGMVRPIDTERIPSYEQTLELMRARRSVRAFDDEPVERAQVEQIIEAARCAPSAHNIQGTEVLVVEDAALRDAIVKSTAAFFTKTAKQLRNPVIRGIMRFVAKDEIDDALELIEDFDEITEAVAQGLDPILRGAPCLLVFHSAPGANFPNVNANLALHNATLACQALGLGSFYLGYVLGACQREKHISRLLGLPPKHRVHAAMGIGEPRHHFPNWVERKQLATKWV